MTVGNPPLADQPDRPNRMAASVASAASVPGTPVALVDETADDDVPLDELAGELGGLQAVVLLVGVALLMLGVAWLGLGTNMARPTPVARTGVMAPAAATIYPINAPSVPLLGAVDEVVPALGATPTLAAPVAVQAERSRVPLMPPAAPTVFPAR